MAHGDFGPLFVDLDQHLRNWHLDLDPLARTMLRTGLASVALHLSSRPRDEVVGVTLSVQQPPLNLFLGGDAEQGNLVGRAFAAEDVEEHPENRLFVQARRRKGRTSQTVLDVMGLDLPLIFEQLHARSEQFPARFFDHDDGSFTMVQALPGVDEAWLQSLDRGGTRELADESARELDQRIYRLHCGCDEDRMRVAVKGIYGDDLDSLFQGEEALEVLCPRCGRTWRLGRADLED
jgi:molecular chaperone Hsp33